MRGLEGCLGHPGAILGLSWKNMGATWVQGHPAEMLKSLSLGACAVKTVACQHTSAHATPYKMEHVDCGNVCVCVFVSVSVSVSVCVCVCLCVCFVGTLSFTHYMISVAILPQALVSRARTVLRHGRQSIHGAPAVSRLWRTVPVLQALQRMGRAQPRRRQEAQEKALGSRMAVCAERWCWRIVW